MGYSVIPRLLLNVSLALRHTRFSIQGTKQSWLKVKHVFHHHYTPCGLGWPSLPALRQQVYVPAEGLVSRTCLCLGLPVDGAHRHGRNSGADDHAPPYVPLRHLVPDLRTTTWGKTGT